MKELHLIDIAYNLAKSNFKDEKFEFNTLWKLVVKESKISNDEANKIIGMFYTELLSDKRFIFVGKNVWRLREFVKFNEYEDYAKNLFDFDDLIEEIEEDEEEAKSKDDSDDSEMEDDNNNYEENNFKTNSTDDESDEEEPTPDDDQSDLEEIENDTEGTL